MNMLLVRATNEVLLLDVNKTLIRTRIVHIRVVDRLIDIATLLRLKMSYRFATEHCTALIDRSEYLTSPRFTVMKRAIDNDSIHSVIIQVRCAKTLAAPALFKATNNVSHNGPCNHGASVMPRLAWADCLSDLEHSIVKVISVLTHNRKIESNTPESFMQMMDTTLFQSMYSNTIN